MPWRSPSRLRSEPSAAARQAPLAGGRLLTVMMLRGYYRPSDAVRTKGINAARATGPIRNLPHDLREQLHLSCHPAFALLIPVDLVDGAFNCTKANYRTHSIGPMALPRKRPHFFCGVIKTRSTIFYEFTAIHSLANESQFR